MIQPIAYNPGRYTDEELERLFVARLKEFNYFLENILANTPGECPQAHLIIGQRGMGKSTLLHRLAAELRKEPNNERFIPLTFPEELYNVNSLAKFWLTCLDALADALERGGYSSQLQELDDEISDISQIKSGDTIFKVFQKWAKRLDRRLVLLIDNVNLIFSRLSKDEQHKLRAALMRGDAPVLIGGSVTEVSQVENYSEPFYDFILIHRLKSLGFEDAVAVLKNIARLQNNEVAMRALEQHPARLKTLHQLTGGSPRTMTLLYPVIAGGFSGELYRDLESLLDSVTPLYKSRFEELTSAKMQTILDAIALNWAPISLEQIRKTTGMNSQQISPQLNRLTDAGWIDKVQTHDTRSKRYQVSERFFNIWYLMRRSSRRQRREVEYLTVFMEQLFGSEIVHVGNNTLGKPILNDRDATYRLALSGAWREHDVEMAGQMEGNAYRHLIKMGGDDESIFSRFDIPEKYLTEEIQKEISILNNKKRAQNWEEALLIAKKLVKLDVKNPRFYFDLGFISTKLGHFLNAESFYDKVLEFDTTDEGTWNNLGNLYQNHLSKYTEAEKAYHKAIEINDKYSYAWNNLGNLYQNHLSKYTEAEKAYHKAIEINDKYSYAWNNLGNLYQNHLSKYTEAEKAYHKAIELDDKSFSAWNSLGNLYQDHLAKYESAEDAYHKAIEITQNNEFPILNLTFLLRDKLGNIEKAKEIFATADRKESILKASYSLNDSLFHAYDQNMGLMSKAFKEALDISKGLIKPEIQDDWYRFATVILKNNWTKPILETFKETGYRERMRPYYEAISALSNDKPQLYVNSIPVEMQELTRDIMARIKALM